MSHCQIGHWKGDLSHVRGVMHDVPGLSLISLKFILGRLNFIISYDFFIAEFNYQLQGRNSDFFSDQKDRTWICKIREIEI